MAKSATKANVAPTAGKKVMSLAQIDAAIERIVKKGQELRDDAHACLVGIIDHYIDNGDYTRLPKLMDATNNYIGNSIAQAMAQWVNDNVTSLRWEDRKFVHIPKTEKAIKDIVIKDDDGKVVFEGNARDYPFYKYEIKRDVKPFDFAAAFAALIRRAEAAYEKNLKEDAHNLVNHAQIEVLKSINLDSFKALKDEDLPRTEPANTNENEAAEAKAKPATGRKPRGGAKLDEMGRLVA